TLSPCPVRLTRKRGLTKGGSGAEPTETRASGSKARHTRTNRRERRRFQPSPKLTGGKPFPSVNHQPFTTLSVGFPASQSRVGVVFAEGAGLLCPSCPHRSGNFPEGPRSSPTPSGNFSKIAAAQVGTCRKLPPRKWGKP